MPLTRVISRAQVPFTGLRTEKILLLKQQNDSLTKGVAPRLVLSNTFTQLIVLVHIMLALIVHVKCQPSKSGGFATRLSTKVIKGVSNSKKMSSSLLVVSTFEATPLVTGEFTIKTRMHLVDVLSLLYHQLLFASVLYSTINAPGFIMLKVVQFIIWKLLIIKTCHFKIHTRILFQIITILVISGCALGSPVVDQSVASSSSNNQFESTGVVIKQIESSLDVNDAVLKQRLGMFIAIQV